MNIFLFIVMTFSVFSPDKIEKECDCNIVPGVGINSIVVGESNLKDVQNEFGNIHRKKFWRKGVEFDFFGSFNLYLEYKNIARFETLKKSRRDKKVVKFITLDSNSSCKTKGGIGIGSKFNDVVNDLGRPDMLHYSTIGKDNIYTMFLDYGSMSIMFNVRDSAVNTVSEIEFY